jgi:prolyl 4-hydroxylase
MPDHPAISTELRQWVLATRAAGHDAHAIHALLHSHGYREEASRLIVAEVPRQMPDTGPRGLRPRHPEAPLADAGGHEVKVGMSLTSPTVRLLEGLVSGEEGDALIELARPRLARALTVDQAGRQRVDTRRTSAGMFFRIGETPLIERIEARLADLLGIPVNHGEGLQVLHYGPGQEYEPHYDWFDPTQPGFEAVTAHGGQRIASVVMYLNTPEAGGGTGFPHAGLTVTAVKGGAVYFAYDTNDTASLHAGLPVERGEKWIATKWLRERPFVR